MVNLEIRLISDWQALAHFCARYEQELDFYCFQSNSWQQTWYETIGAKAGVVLKAISVWQNGALVLLLPLAVYPTPWGRRLGFIGDPADDYGAPLISRVHFSDAQQQAFCQIWPKILKEVRDFDFIWMTKIPALIHGRTNPLCWLGLEASDQSALFQNVQGAWATFYETQVKNGIRKDSRRQLARLEKIGSLAFLEADAENFQALVTRALDFKSIRLQAQGQRDVFADPDLRAFYLNVPPQLTSDARIHLSYVKVGEEVVAIHWGVLSKKRFYFILLAHAPGDWQKYSVGRLHIEHLLKQCFDQGIEAYDFTIGSESYKKDWCSSSMAILSYSGWNTPRGSIWYCMRRAKRIVKALVKKPEISKPIDKTAHL